MSVKKFLVVGIIIFSTVFTPLYAEDRETLAVLDFTTEAVSKNDMKAIVEFLSSELFNTRKYTVIDVSQRETILDEMAFSMSGCANDSCDLEIGKLLSAELIVVGILSKIGSHFLLSVRMLETETSKTMGIVNGKYKDLDELISSLKPIAINLAFEDTLTRDLETDENGKPVWVRKAMEERNNKSDATKATSLKPTAHSEETDASESP